MDLEVQTDKAPGNTAESSKINVSQTLGEVLDRASILALKQAHGEGSLDQVQLSHLEHEQLLLWEEIDKFVENAPTVDIDGQKIPLITSASVQLAYGRLMQLNSQLWQVEDLIRAMKATGSMYTPEGEREFQHLALLVPWLNDQRSAVKAFINTQAHGDAQSEVKIYTQLTAIEDQDGEEE